MEESKRLVPPVAQLEREKIIPRNIPYPIGEPGLKPSPTTELFKGGYLPEDKYPLVNEPPSSRNRVAHFSAEQWKNLLKSVERPPSPPNLDELLDIALQQHSYLSEKQLTEIDKSKRTKEMDEKAILANLEAKLNEIKAERRAHQLEQSARAKEILRQSDERYSQVKQALLQSEVMATNERNIAEKHRKTLLDCQREWELEQKLQEEDSKLQRKLKERELNRLVKEKRVREIQRIQMQINKENRRKEQEQSKEERRQYESQAEAEQREKYTARELRKRYEMELAQSQRTIGAIYDEKRRLATEVDKAELERARAVQEEFYRRQEEFERLLKDRTAQIERRQEFAQEKYKSEVAPKAEDKDRRENARIAQQMDENDELVRREQEALEEKKTLTQAEIKRFLDRDQAIKEQQRLAALEAKADLRQQEIQAYHKHLQQVGEKHSRRDQRKSELIHFWGQQVDELNHKRQELIQMKSSEEERKKSQELEQTQSFLQDLNVLEMEQHRHGKNVHHIQKVRQSLLLMADPVVEASDGSNVRLQQRLKAKPFLFSPNSTQPYSPHNERERLSLNWNV